MTTSDGGMVGGPDSDDEVDAVLLDLLGFLAGPGAAGARWSARRLKTETYTEVQRYDPAQYERIATLLSDLMQAHPQTYPGPRGLITVLRSVVGSGFADMNPTYLIAVLDPEWDRLSVAAHAKEGLIKQHSARKAVQRLLSQLSAAR